MLRALAGKVRHLAFDDTRVGAQASWGQSDSEDLGHHPLV